MNGHWLWVKPSTCARGCRRRLGECRSSMDRCTFANSSNGTRINKLHLGTVPRNSRRTSCRSEEQKLQVVVSLVTGLRCCEEGPMTMPIKASYAELLDVLVR